MATADKCCSIVPYFKVKVEELEAFERLSERFVEKTRNEPKCLYYGWSFDGDHAHCREGYQGADGVLEHFANVALLLGEALKMADLTRLEIHGPDDELAMLREPLSDYKPRFFTLRYGFRR